MKPTEPLIYGRHVVIVHNTDSGIVTGAKGAWRRLSRQDACSLCALTRGVRSVNPRWQRFLDSLSEPVQTLTRDRFRADHAPSYWRNIDLPVILLQTGPKLERLVSAAEIRKSTTVKELIDKVNEALKDHPA